MLNRCGLFFAAARSLTAVMWVLVFVLLSSCGGEKGADFLKIGLSEEPKTLNIWLASDANSQKILSLIYQPLYMRDPETLALVPWLADGQPDFDAQTNSYSVRIKQARWSDGSEVTSEDVAFTADIIKKFRVPRYYSRWKFVKKIETPDRRTIRFYLKEPQAIFLTRTLMVSVVPKKQWLDAVRAAEKQQKPLIDLLNYKIEQPMGCGPFVLKEWRRGAYLHLQKNPYFFGRSQQFGRYELGPFIDNILFKVYGTADVAVLGLKKGAIDMFWWGIQPGYLEDLQRRQNIQIFSSEKSAVYFMGFNVRRPPFNDARLRRAVAVLIDKDFIISRILQGYGTRMDSIVPPGNTYWSCPTVPSYGKGLSREERIRRAYEILSDAGYTWTEPPIDENGNAVPAKGLRMPDGRKMKDFAILTPPADYDPHRAMCGMMIQEWLRAFGMPAFSKPMAFSALLDQVKGCHEFDAFILGYGNLSLDPDYLRNFFHSENDKQRGWNMSGYRNPDFDRIAEISSREMNQDRRRELIVQMQKIIIDDVPYIPIYNPALIEAVRKEKFSGWIKSMGGIGNAWSFCQIKPNPAGS